MVSSTPPSAGGTQGEKLVPSWRAPVVTARPREKNVHRVSGDGGEEALLLVRTSVPVAPPVRPSLAVASPSAIGFPREHRRLHRVGDRAGYQGHAQERRLFACPGAGRLPEAFPRGDERLEGGYSQDHWPTRRAGSKHTPLETPEQPQSIDPANSAQPERYPCRGNSTARINTANNDTDSSSSTMTEGAP